MYWIMSLVGALIVGALLAYLLGKVFGRGEALPPVAKSVVDREHVRQWQQMPITAESMNNVAFTLSARGYSPQEVDYFLDRVQQQLAELEHLERSQDNQRNQDTNPGGYSS